MIVHFLLTYVTRTFSLLQIREEYFIFMRIQILHMLVNLVVGTTGAGSVYTCDFCLHGWRWQPAGFRGKEGRDGGKCKRRGMSCSASVPGRV